MSVTAPGTYVFQLVAVGDDGLSATSNVQVTFLTSLSVTAVLADVPIRPDPGTSASEKLTITVTNPNGSPAAGASVTISSAPRVIYKTNAQGQVAISLAVNLDTTAVKISATANRQTASINQTLREVTTPQSCTVEGTVVTVLQLSLDLLGPEAEVKGLLNTLKLIIDLLSKGISGVKALHTPATTKLIQYTVAIPGAPDIYALQEQLFDQDGRQIGSVGPYYSSRPADPDPAVCVLSTAG